MQSTVTQDRELYIGGSDIPAIMGISRFTKRFDLLQYKSGIKENTFKGNKYTEYGNVMESEIRDYINTEMGYNFIEDKIILRDSDVLPTRYHADGHDENENMLLEIKTTSRIAREFDAIDKGVPFDEYQFDFYKGYYVQLIYGMRAYGCRYGMLAVYERPDDMSRDFDSKNIALAYVVDVNEHQDTVKEIVDAVAKFREDYKVLVNNPFAMESDLPSFSPLAPIADKLMRLESGIAEAKRITEEYDNLKKALCREMADHGIKSWTMPNGTKVTYVAKGEDKMIAVFDEKRFRKEHEKLYGEYQVDTIKRGKSAYVRVTPMAQGENA